MSSFEGARADIVWEANSGQAVRAITEVGEQYLKTTSAMSDEALRAALAQEKLIRAIRIGGPESIAAQRATLAYRSEMKALAVAANEAAAAQEKQAAASRASAAAGIGGAGAWRRDSQLLRGAAVGSGLGRSGLLFGSTAFIGGLAAAAGLKAVLSAAEADQVALGKLEVALQDTGHSLDDNRARIEEWLSAQVKATAFTREDLATALAANVRRYGDLDQALRANNVEADVARAKGISLADAQALIQRASTGNSRSLLTLGVTYAKTTANADALKASTKFATEEQKAAAKAADQQANSLSVLDAVSAKYHGSAEKYLGTTAGKQAELNAQLKQSEAIIGTALLPTYTHLVTGIANYLDKLNRSGELQRDANAAARVGSTVFRALGRAIHGVAAVVGPVDHLLGGFTKTASLLTAAMIAFKTRGAPAFVLGAQEIGGAAVLAAGEVSGLAAAEAAAAGGATGIILPPGVTVPKGGGGTILPFAKPLATKLGAGAFGAALAFASQGEKGSTFVRNGRLYGRIGGHTIDLGPAGSETGPPLGSLYPVPPGATLADIVRGRTKGAFTQPGKGGGSSLILGLTEAQQTALYRAGGTASTADDVAALHDELSIYNRLLGQKGLNAAQRNALLQGRNAVTDQLSSIAASAASAASSAASKAAEARRKAAAEAAKKRKALLDRLERAPVQLRIELQTAIAHKDSEEKIVAILREEKTAIERQIRELEKIGAGKQAILRARTNEAQIQTKINQALRSKNGGAAENEKQFLQSFMQIFNAFAPNAFPAGPGGGLAEARLWELVHEARRTNGHLASLLAAGTFPATGYAHIAAESVTG